MTSTVWTSLFGGARVLIFAGHYGSGKSEIAVQYARMLAEAGKRVLLADMDIVNPFFRSLDARTLLEADGVRVAAPLFANTNVDVPALVPEITTALRDPAMHVVLDVGGDGDGARVLGRYHRDIDREGTAMVFVFNASRPMTRDAETAAVHMEEIEYASRQRFTHILNNTHLMDETTTEGILAGEREASRLAAARRCPLAASVVAVPDGGVEDGAVPDGAVPDGAVPDGAGRPVAHPAAESIPRVPLRRTLGVRFD